MTFTIINLLNVIVLIKLILTRIHHAVTYLLRY